MTSIFETAKSWLAQDPDAATKQELQALLDTNDEAALNALFSERLEFGTAGLRGALGPGPNRMNRVVVAQAAAGLGNYLLGKHERPTVVIGYDARHNSEVFARDTAEVLAGMGVAPQVLPKPLPTPVLAFAIRRLEASAGVMVTASHNPPQDNGYKVYMGDGSQIVPPADTDIMAAIASVGRVDELPRSESYERLDDAIEQQYIAAVADLVDSGPRDITAVYTPLHGVGHEVLAAVLGRSGFTDVHVVAEQSQPDPQFPTVAFPNPEEPGAMDLALALAEEVSADIVIAHDPDADRCAVGERYADGVRMFSGDEVGALLADALLADGVEGVYACSIVSSTLLLKQAAKYGQAAQQTLTGFKWLGKIEGLAYGYEEALGYDVAPHLTLDKDGISAALRILALAAQLKAEGRSLNDRLNEIYSEFGVHQTGQLSVRFSHISEVEPAMQLLRTEPPRTLGDHAVTEVHDLTQGWRDLPPTDAIYLSLGEAGRVIARPSGTEPKLKCYIELVVPVGDGDPDAVRATAKESVAALASELQTYLGL